MSRFSGSPFARHKVMALGRMRAGKKNKLEEAYGQQLELRKIAGEVAWYKFEGIKLRLADNTFYTPDYAVMLVDGQMEIHECKGFMTDDAAVKLKTSAEMYPFRFYLVRQLPKRDGGGFNLTEV